MNEDSLEEAKLEQEIKDDEVAEAIYKPKVTMQLIIAVFSCAIGTVFVSGFNASSFNNPETAIKQFLNKSLGDQIGRTPTDSELLALWTVIGSLSAFGAIFGTRFGLLSDRFGRKKILLFIAYFGAVGTILLIIAKYVNAFECLLLGRFIVGMCGGASTATTSVYLTEISAKEFRGGVALVTNLGMVTGIFMTTVFGLSEIFGTYERFPFIYVVQLVPVVITAVAMQFCPESPRYLYIKKNDEEGARKSLQFFRRAPEFAINQEVKILKKEKELCDQETEVTLKELFTNRLWKKRTIVALISQASQQFSGINAVLFYSKGIFSSAHLSERDATYGTLGVTGLFLVLTASSSFLIDRVGRAPLMNGGYAVTTLMCFLMCPFILYSETKFACAILSIVCMLIYVGVFALGPGGIPWMITAEIFPQNARVTAVSMATCWNWICTFIVVIIFPFLQDAIGSYVFIIFGVITLCSTIFSILFIPETKGKSSEEIEKIFAPDSYS